MPAIEIGGNFRFFNDDGSETSRTAMAAANTSVGLTKGANRKCRWRAQVANESAGGGEVPLPVDGLIYKVQAAKNGGAYFDLTTSSSGLKVAATSQSYANHDPTTSQPLVLTGPGTDTFTAGSIQSNDGSTAGLAGLPNGQYTEFEFCLTTVDADVVVGDVFDVRLVKADGTALAEYTAACRVTILPNAATPRLGGLAAIGAGR